MNSVRYRTASGRRDFPERSDMSEIIVKVAYDHYFGGTNIWIGEKEDDGSLRLAAPIDLL